MLPYHLVHHFVRGYFDGDGSIHIKGKRGGSITIVSTEMFLLSLGQILNSLGIRYQIYTRHPERETSTRMLQITYWDGIKIFLSWIYRDHTICLKRKHNKAKLVLEAV